jgi:hypothetical protein
MLMSKKKTKYQLINRATEQPTIVIKKKSKKMGNLNRHTLNDIEFSGNSSLPMDDVIHYFLSQIRRRKLIVPLL